MTAILSVAIWVALVAIDPLYGTPSLANDAMLCGTPAPVSVVASALAFLDEDRQIHAVFNPVIGYPPIWDTRGEPAFFPETYLGPDLAKDSLYKRNSRLLI